MKQTKFFSREVDRPRVSGFPVKEAYLKLVAYIPRMQPSKLKPWQNPRIYRENVVKPHSPLLVYNSKAECFEAATQPRLLPCPQWTVKLADAEDPVEVPFKLYDSPKKVPKSLSTITFDDTIPVPMNWQMCEKFNLPPVYTNLIYPWSRRGIPPFHLLSYSIPNKRNHTGVYQFTLKLSDEWIQAVESRERSLFVIIHGVSSAVKVCVGDQYVGYCQDSMTEAEFNISRYINRGEETRLFLTVYRFCDGSYLEDQDHWWLSGIFRDIELQCRPNVGFADYTIETIVAERAAKIYVTVDHLVEAYDPSLKYSLVGTLHESDMTEVASSRFELDGRSLSIPLILDVENPRLWSCGDPYLYFLVISLVDNDGKEYQAEVSKVGIRTLDFIDKQLCVNREPVTICGVNRHEHDMYKGKVMTEEVLLSDIKTLKLNNFNAVRCCHYPNVHRWYELCDEYGIYVVDEANMENHGFQLLGGMSLLQVDSRWKSQILWRTKSMWYRSKNHASVIIYSLGNESGTGANTRNCAKWLRTVDGNRPIQYEGGNKDGDSPTIYGTGQDPIVTDIVCPMYHQPVRIAKTVSKKSEGRPLILCEYGHAMGNSGGGLNLYYDLFWNEQQPQLQGGFIWDLIDQGLSLPSHRNGEPGYGRDFVKEGDTKFCINGLLFPDRTPHPVMFEVKYLNQPFEIRYHVGEEEKKVFITATKRAPYDVELTNLDVKMYILSRERPYTAETQPSIVTALAVNHDHEHEAVVGEELPWIDEYDEGSWLRVELALIEDKPWAPAGHVVANETFQLEALVTTKTLESLTAGVDTGFNAVTEDEELKVNTARYDAGFDLNEGLLTGLFSAAGVSIMKSPIKHCFYRAATDNDEGGISAPTRVLNEYRSFRDQWRRLGLHKLKEKVKSCKVVFADSTHAVVEVVSKHVSGMLSVFKTTVTYTFTRDEIELKVDVHWNKAARSARSLPRVGLHFEVGAEMDQVTYCGRGPHENYPDRKRSAGFASYKTQVDDMHVPYVVPSECGGRSDVKWFKITEPEKESGLEVSYEANDDLPAEETQEGFPNPNRGMLSSPVIKQGKIGNRCAGTTGAQLNLSRFSVDALEEAKHQYELVASENVHVHLDTAFMGLGGDSSWLPQTHNQYLVGGSDWSYTVRLKPL